MYLHLGIDECVAPPGTGPLSYSIDTKRACRPYEPIRNLKLLQALSIRCQQKTAGRSGPGKRIRSARLQDETVAKCPKCGKEIENEGHRHCTTCNLKHDTIRRGEGGVRWEHRIPLVANSVLWRDLFFALGIPVLIIGAIVVIVSDAQTRLDMIILFSILYGIFLLIALAVMVALSWSLGGGLSATFYVNDAGIGYEGGPLAKKVNRGTLVLSLMSGSVKAAGTTLTAISQEENFIAWEDVHSVKIYAHPMVVHIRSKELINPIALYCTTDTFGRVTDMISKKVPLTAIR